MMANFNASARILITFAPATILLISLLYRYLDEQKVITLLLILVGSISMAFSLKSVNSEYTLVRFYQVIVSYVGH